MRSFAGGSFFRLFDLLLSTSNPGLKLSHWTLNGVDWERERYSFASRAHGFAIEIFTLRRPGRGGWSLLVVKEYWWAGEENRAVKSLRWARPTNGRRGDVIAWLRAQQSALDHPTRPSLSISADT